MLTAFIIGGEARWNVCRAGGTGGFATDHLKGRLALWRWNPSTGSRPRKCVVKETEPQAFEGLPRIPTLHRDAGAGQRAARTWRAQEGVQKLAYIDCLRGYAVLLVIVCHTTYVYPQLPSVPHALGRFGWYGVQLFFLASSVTLFMSAHHERVRTGAVDARNFFLRRFLRIAPMYYLAAGFYTLSWPPVHARLSQLAASLAFVNVWHPVTTTTTGDWQPVPGGWSIGVEFTFYFLFPAFFTLARSFRRTLLLLAICVATAAAADSLLFPRLTAEYGYAAADNYLYFWFLNQAPIFILGAATFFIIRAIEDHPEHPLAQRVRRDSGALIAAGVALELVIALAPIRFAHQFLLAPAIPQHFAASIGFVVLIIGLSQARRSLALNNLAARFGRISFSGYLLHFAVLRWMLEAHPALFHTQASGWTAIAAFLIGLTAVAIVTLFAASVTYAGVEEPFMRLAKRLTPRRPQLLASAPETATGSSRRRRPSSIDPADEAPA
jgi:peptidoglycan/LPS O-acetylase OafA/YrhL